MRRYSAVLIATLVALSSCIDQAERTSSADTDAWVKSFQGDADDACFDIQMAVWMEKFQHYQQTGLDMYSADLKAREASLQAFRDCHRTESNTNLSSAARKN